MRWRRTPTAPPNAMPMLMVHEQTGTAPRRRCRTIGVDKNYDTRAFVDVMRALRRTCPHTSPDLAAARLTDGPPGTYGMSQSYRSRIERAFGWLKTIGWLRKVKLRGLLKVGWLVMFAGAAFNLLRSPKLLDQVTA